MNHHGRNLLVIIREYLPSEKTIEQVYDHLHEMLAEVESPEQFCIAHELVNRNRITSNKKKILRESRNFQLRPFRFLINKN